MRAVSFREANQQFLPPQGQESEVDPLPAWYDPEAPLIVSKWRGSLLDRLKFLVTGEMWLFVQSTHTPPTALSADYPFEEDDSDDSFGLSMVILFCLALLGSFAWIVISGV